MTKRVQPDNRSDNQPDSQSDTEQTIQPIDLNESATSSSTERALTANIFPTDPAAEVVAPTQTSTLQADAESSNEPSKEFEPGGPTELVEQPTAASSNGPASPISEKPAQTEQPTGKVQAAEATSEDTTLTPAEILALAAVPAVPVEPAVDLQEATDATKRGRVDGEGRVCVQDGGIEREVGQFPDALIAEAMALCVCRHLDLKATTDLFATRLPQLSAREADSALSSISESPIEPATAGDLGGLRARFATLKTVAAERHEAASVKRVAAKEQILKERTVIVEHAEAIAERDPARTRWKNSGAGLRELFESQKAAQRRKPRLDRLTEDGLWECPSHARAIFDRRRRQFFSGLDVKQAQVRAAKEALVERIEEMQIPTDWASTSAKYRNLPAERKRAGRVSRKEDSALWARSRAAQQVFCDARRAKGEAVDVEFAKSLKVKEALVAKAEVLLSIKDTKVAEKTLRPIQDAQGETGRVPHDAVYHIKGRMCAVEDTVCEAESAEWRHADPETRARARGLVGQLQDAITSLEKDLAAAQAADDAKKIAEAEIALTACRAWFEQILHSAKV